MPPHPDHQPPTSIIHPSFTPDALPAAILQIYPGLGQAQNMLDSIPGGLQRNYNFSFFFYTGGHPPSEFFKLTILAACSPGELMYVIIPNLRLIILGNTVQLSQYFDFQGGSFVGY